MENQDIFKSAGVLLDYIRENHLRAGDALPTETMLVRDLQMSRVVVRESLVCLKALNLVSSRRGSGYKITSGNLAGALAAALHGAARSGLTELNELYELRRTLEIGAIADAVAHATDADKKEVVAALADMEAIKVIENDEDLALYNQTELRFHRALLRPARCQALEIVNQAMEDFFKYRMELSSDPIRMNAEEVKRTNLAHRALADAFMLGEAHAAIILMNKHLH